MKKLFSTILASTMLLSTFSMTAMAEENQETPQAIQVATLSTTPEDYFEFTGGVITGYIGFDSEVVIPSTIQGQPVVAIGEKAFYQNRSISSVVIPDGVVSIGTRAFDGCQALVTLTMPASVKTIGSNAFNNNTSSLYGLQILNYTGSEIEFFQIDVLWSYNNCLTDAINFFNYTEGMHNSTTPNPSNATSDENFVFVNGVITDYIGLGGDVVIPSSINGHKVLAIGNSAFRQSGVTSVVIPEGVLTISGKAFEHCNSLVSATIPATVYKIGSKAFHSLGSLAVINYTGTEIQYHQIDTLWAYNGNLQSSILNFNYVIPVPEIPQIDTSAFPEWAWTYVNFVKDNIMPDISDENYSISATRGTIAQSLYNMCGGGGTVAATHTFGDVGSFGTAIAWCHGNSVMNGISSTEFGTESNVTREQFALILQKAGESLGKTTANADEIVLSMFHDTDTISSWAKGGMAWAVANGLMNGNNNNLNPKGNITRTEVAVMLYNFDKL